MSSTKQSSRQSRSLNRPLSMILSPGAFSGKTTSAAPELTAVDEVAVKKARRRSLMFGSMDSTAHGIVSTPSPSVSETRSSGTRLSRSGSVASYASLATEASYKSAKSTKSTKTSKPPATMSPLASLASSLRSSVATLRTSRRTPSTDSDSSMPSMPNTPPDTPRRGTKTNVPKTEMMPQFLTLDIDHAKPLVPEIFLDQTSSIESLLAYADAITPETVNQVDAAGSPDLDQPAQESECPAMSTTNAQVITVDSAASSTTPAIMRGKGVYIYINGATGGKPSRMSAVEAYDPFLVY